MTHKTNLTGHAHAVDAGALLLGLGGVSGAVSCWGIGLGVVRPAGYRMTCIIKFWASAWYQVNKIEYFKYKNGLIAQHNHVTKLVKAGHFWLGQGGSCHLGLGFGIN
jgi:hypothetical protein